MNFAPKQAPAGARFHRALFLPADYETASSTTVSQLHPVSACPHQGQWGRQVTKTRAWRHFMVAMEAGLWRSGRVRTSRPEILG